MPGAEAADAVFGDHWLDPMSLARRPLPIVAAVLAALVAACANGGAGTTSGSTASTASTGPGAGGSGTGATGASGAPGSTGTAPASAAVPSFAHVYLVVLENKDFGSIVGSSAAPFINGLIAKSGLATSYLAVAHPSQPNYIALFSGSTQGVADDGTHDLSGRNLADQLEAAGRSWAVYAQDYPGNCFTGSSASGGGEGFGAGGAYARKHNPAISFTGISSNPARCARIHSLAAFDPAAADFELIVPNECNDMHSCGVDVGDRFLSTLVPKLTANPAFARSVLFITTDEGTTGAGGGGRVATIVVGPLVRPGFSSAEPFTHYSLLRTIEDAWSLGCLANACTAANMAAFFSR